MKSNIIICGQGHGIDCVYKGLLKHQQKFVLCTDDEALRARAAADGVPVVSHYLEAISETTDIVLTAAYKPKIAKSDLERARFINIHYALLPKYRGMHAVVWAILNGESEVGFTVHQTSELLDQGPVIYQESLPVAEKTSWELMLELDELVATRIFKIIRDYAANEIIPISQNEADALFVAPRNQSDCMVCWSGWDAVFFSRALRALVPPYPLPFFIHCGAKVEIVRASVIFKKYIEINGHLVYIDGKSVYIKIPDGLLVLDLIRIDGVEIPAIQHFSKIGLRFK